MMKKHLKMRFFCIVLTNEKCSQKCTNEFIDKKITTGYFTRGKGICQITTVYTVKEIGGIYETGMDIIYRRSLGERDQCS